MTSDTRSEPPFVPFDMGPDSRAGQELPKLAALCSSYRPGSHSQHTVDRFLMGYEYDGQLRYPPFQVASMYVDHPHERELCTFAPSNTASSSVRISPLR